MRKQKSLNYNKLLLALFISLLLTGCNDEDKSENDNSLEPGYVSFVLRVSEMPGDPNAKAATRNSIPFSDDGKIETLDILAFTVDDTDVNQITYAYTTRAVLVGPTSNLDEIQYKAHLKYLGKKQRFIFLANTATLAQELDEKMGEQPSVSYNITPGSEDEDFLRQFQINFKHDWRFDTSALNAIPMYAPATGAERVEDISQLNGGNAIDLLRMLACVDITVAKDLKSRTGYQLKEAYLFKRRIDGYVSYRQQDYHTVEKRVTAPWVTNTDIEDKILMSAPYEVNSFEEITRSIYTFETEDPEKNNLHRYDVTAIVVGLTNGNDIGERAGKIYYYRIDIPVFDGTVARTNSMGPLLRNHRYTITINNVTDEGDDTPEEAYYGTLRLTAEVQPWQVKNIEDVEFEGSYNLWVSYTYIKIPAMIFSHNFSFYVHSTHPNGFILGYNDFLKIYHVEPGPYTPDPFEYHVTTSNEDVMVLFYVLDRLLESKESVFCSYIIHTGKIWKYVHIEVLGTNSGWGHTAAVVDWEDIYLAGLGGKCRLDIERDHAYFDKGTGAGRKNLGVVVVGSGSNDNKWVVSEVDNQANLTDNGWLELTRYVGLADSTAQLLQFDLTEHTGGADRVAKVTLRLGNLKKIVTITQYDREGITLKDGTTTLVPDADRYVVHKVAADGNLKKLKIYTGRKGCTWKAEAVKGAGVLLAGIATAAGKGEITGEDFAFWVNKKSNIPIGSEAIIRISPTEENKLEFEPYYLRIITE